MHLVQARANIRSKDNWQKTISILPVFKSFRVRPADVTLDGQTCVVSVFNLKRSHGFTWDRTNSEDLVSQFEELGLPVNGVEVIKQSYGFDLKFPCKMGGV